MSFQRDNSAFQAKQTEVQVNHDELFFSCTDDRGVITAVNPVFERISGFSWTELNNAPHKIVRHPEMPKGMFHLIWDRLKRGVSTGAYVLNQSKDGQAYWIFTVMSPIEKGFISLHFKPSAPLFEALHDIYKNALEAEKEGLSAQDSAAKILADLNALGYADYDAFETHALGAEVQARDSILKRSGNKLLATLTAMSVELMALSTEQKRLFGFFEAIRGIPSNMRIVASRLEPAGGPISAISQNYRLMSDEVQGHLNGFRSNCDKDTVSAFVSERVRNVIFLVSAAALYAELNENCLVANEAIKSDANQIDIPAVLGGLQSYYGKDSVQALTIVSRDVVGLARSSKDMRQLVAGLDSIRVLCRVEAGRLGAESVSLTPVIDQLDKFHKEIDRSLEQILFHADKISSQLEIAMKNSAIVSAGRIRH